MNTPEAMIRAQLRPVHGRWTTVRKIELAISWLVLQTLVAKKTDSVKSVDAAVLPRTGGETLRKPARLQPTP